MKHKSKEIIEKYHFSGRDWKLLKIPSEIYQNTGYVNIGSNTGTLTGWNPTEMINNYI